MHLDGLDVFIEVVEAKSFIRAAERLRMAPTTVSSKIARLEQALGKTLIRRTTRRFHLTEAGESYYHSCVGAIGALRQAETQLKSLDTVPSGVLRITATTNIAQSMLLPVMEQFTALYEKVSVDLIVTNRRLDLLAEGVDIAVRAGVLDDSRLKVRKLFVARLGLWASRDYLRRKGAPTRPDELKAHQFIGFTPWMRAPLPLKAGNRVLQPPVTCRISCDDLGCVRALLARGAGIGILGEQDAREAGLVPVLPAFGSSTGPVSLVYHAQKFPNLAVRAFIDLAAKIMSANPSAR